MRDNYNVLYHWHGVTKNVIQMMISLKKLNLALKGEMMSLS